MMKLYSTIALFLGLLTSSAAQDPSDACDIGFATQNGGTTGGQGGETVTVSTLEALREALESPDPLIVILDAQLSGNDRIDVASDKTIIGQAGASLDNIALSMEGVSNVIIRNLIFTKVLASNGDAIHIYETTNVWVDHCELSSERNGGGYDGLIDITAASDYVTVSHTYIHDHGKASLCGAGDDDTGDIGKLHVTYAYNHWENNVSRGPLLRFGTGHIYNCYYDRQANAVNLRLDAQALVQSTVFEGCTAGVVSEAEVDGYAVVEDVEFNGAAHDAPSGTLTDVPYDYELLGSSSVKDAVVGVAGATLNF